MTEVNEYYKDFGADAIRELFKTELKIDDEFEITKFEYNSALKKLVGLKSIELDSKNGGFNLFERIMTSDWMQLSNK